MPSFKLFCSYCGKEYPADTKIWRCTCGKPLDIEVDLKDVGLMLEKLRTREPNMWRYRESLPIKSVNNIISLNEGYTPLVTRKLYGLEVHFKLDYLNPTGSFKDRGASSLITHLVEIGVDTIVEDSSGNAGAAIAAYSSIAGIKCKVFVPAGAPEGKKLQIRSYGAELVEVSGSRAEVSKAAMKESKKSYYASHLWNPFFIEGLKTISYEYVEQTKGYSPDVVFIPVGSGGLFLGIYKGFKELKKLNVVNVMPRLIAVQAQGFTPVYDLIYGKHESEIPKVILADGIAIPHPPRVDQVVKAIKETKGDVVVVYNNEIIKAFKELAKMGFFVEPTSATVLAALWKSLDLGLVERGETVFLPLTGFGLKAIDKLLKIEVLHS